MVEPITMVADGGLRGMQERVSSSDAQSAVFRYPGAKHAHCGSHICRRTRLCATEFINDTGAETRRKSILELEKGTNGQRIN